MTAVVAGPYALACALLVVAGVSKVRRPSRARAGDRVLGAGEVALGVLAFAEHRLAPLVALSYAVFVVVAARAKARQRACGCFGGEERLPTTAHVALNAALAVSAAAAVTGDAAPTAYLGFTYAVLLATAAYLGTAVMTA